VLFDEIEKAHHDVFNVMLQVLDDGRLTDGQGRAVDFRNTVLIMTSNIGSHYFAEGQGDDETVRRQVMDDLRAHFRPEFLNRVDEVVLFHGLTRENIKLIADIQLARVQKRLIDQNITLTVADAAKDLLAREGYDPVFGARPLKRVIQKKILDALSLEILSGRFKECDRIKAVVDKKQAGSLAFERA
jgi:ATP-dependent Clp protease ATP-binding subunit ClpB